MGMCQESLPTPTFERQEREGQLPSHSEKVFFSRNVITAERVRMFSQRARAYILAYHKIRQEQLTDSSTASDLDDITASPVKVEKLLKEFKTHRSAMDFDSNFCKAVFVDNDDDGAKEPCPS